MLSTVTVEEEMEVFGTFNGLDLRKDLLTLDSTRFKGKYGTFR